MVLKDSSSNNRRGSQRKRNLSSPVAISEMKHGLLLFQFGYHLPSPFDSELIADRTSDLAKPFDRLVDRRARVAMANSLVSWERKTLSPAVPRKRTSGNYLSLAVGPDRNAGGQGRMLKLQADVTPVEPMLWRWCISEAGLEVVCPKPPNGSD
jgi:hypothetical protein